MFTQQWFLKTIFVLIFLCLGISCKGKEEHPPEHNMMLMKSNAPSVVDSPLIQSEANKVCMVTDKYMGSEQIPVLVEGKTYYGCCAGCASKLKENQKNVRFSKDLLTGEEVDKATAYIAYSTDGSNNVFYFRSDKTYQQYVDSFRGALK